MAFSYDPEKAGQLLDEAGYTKGSDGLRTMPDGSPIGTIRLAARSESPTSLDTMAFVKEWFGDVGIKAKVENFESSKLSGVILDGDFDVFQWGWYVEPDPDSILSYFTTDAHGGYSDSWYSNPEYDALYEEQHVETDSAKRVEIVKKMQEMLFLDSPYLVTAYNTIGEAVRSDKFACLQPQPDPGGIWLIQYGIHNYLSVRPADQAGDCDNVESSSQATDAAADKGVGSGFAIGAGVLAVVAVLGGGFVLLRRRSSVGDRE